MSTPDMETGPPAVGGRRTAAVVGGNGSIGSAVVRRLRADGLAVAVLDRARPEAAGHPGEFILCDVADPASVAAAVDILAESFDGLDVLVTAQGVLREGRIDTFASADWDLVHHVNARGTYLCIQAALPLLRARDAASIVTISSVSAYVGSVGGFAYTASKGAVSSLTMALSAELAPDGIRINAVCPGWVDGGFTAQALRASDDPAALRARAARAHLLGRMAGPDEVADAVAFLAGDQARFVTGSQLFVDGGFMVNH